MSLPIRNLLLLSLLSCAAHADLFTITFNPTLDTVFGHDPWPYTLNLAGAFTTDGVCSVCTISQSFYSPASTAGLLSIMLYPSGDPDSFEWELGTPRSELFDLEGNATFNRAANTLSAQLVHVDDFMWMDDGSYHANMSGPVDEFGLFLRIPGQPEHDSGVNPNTIPG